MSAEVKAMDVKKVHQQVSVATPKESTATTQGARDFLGNMKVEFSKISWTDSEELRLYTKLVVGATFVMGMGIYMVDLLIQGVLYSLSNVIQFLFG